MFIIIQNVSVKSSQRRESKLKRQRLSSSRAKQGEKNSKRESKISGEKKEKKVRKMKGPYIKNGKQSPCGRPIIG